MIKPKIIEISLNVKKSKNWNYHIFKHKNNILSTQTFFKNLKQKIEQFQILNVTNSFLC